MHSTGIHDRNNRHGNDRDRIDNRYGRLLPHQPLQIHDRNNRHGNDRDRIDNWYGRL